MSFVIAIGGQKGGSGKTTTVCNLAATFKSCGYGVHIVDGDTDQRSALRWTERRKKRLNEAHPITASIPPLNIKNLSDRRWLDEIPGDGIIIIDLQGRDSAYNRHLIYHAADAWLIPFKPSFLDTETGDTRIVEMVRDIFTDRPDIKIDVFLNEAPTSNAIEKRQAAEFLNSIGLTPLSTVIHARKAYRESLAPGLGAIEWTDDKAAQEYMMLFQELCQSWERDWANFHNSASKLPANNHETASQITAN